MENKNISFNNKVVILNQAIKDNDVEKIERIRKEFADKKAIYDKATFDQLKEAKNRLITDLYTNNFNGEEERNIINVKIDSIERAIKEKKAFEKNAELVDEIIAGNYENLVQKSVKRTFIKRRAVATIAAVTTVAIMALGIKGCVDKNKNNTDYTATDATTIVLDNGDETMNIVEETDFEETDAIEPIGTVDPFEFDPLIGSGTNTNGNNTTTGYTNSNNNGGNSSSTSTTTGPTTQTSETSPAFTIPNTTTTVSITYDPDGNPLPITWPTEVTPIPNPTIPDTTPTGTDPLPVEPTVIVLPTPTDVPAPTSTPAPTPVIPTGTIPGETPDVTPTPIPVPTDVPRPATPTPIPEPDPTSSTLPPIPTGDVEGEEDIEFGKNSRLVSIYNKVVNKIKNIFNSNTNQPSYTEETNTIPDPINHVETRNIPGETYVETNYYTDPGYTEEINTIPDSINHVETRDIPGETYVETSFYTSGKTRSLRR